MTDPLPTPPPVPEVAPFPVATPEPVSVPGNSGKWIAVSIAVVLVLGIAFYAYKKSQVPVKVL